MISERSGISCYLTMKPNALVSYKSYLLFKKFTSNFVFLYFTVLHNYRDSSPRGFEKYMNIKTKLNKIGKIYFSNYLSPFSIIE